MIGLGFVGAAMAAAVADANDRAGNPVFDVVGLDRDTPEGVARVDALNRGALPFESPDAELARAIAQGRERGNLQATSDADVLSSADVALVDINLDLSGTIEKPEVDFKNICHLARTLAQKLPEGALIIVETTVPPGTCAKVIAPELETGLESRGLQGDALLLAHSYERVMPGPDYFDSIVNFWRVYAGHTPEAADACEAFLSRVINVEDYPLRRLSTTTASETAKVLENSYRAANIAFVEEWGRMAEAAGVDLFEVISAVRQRPTHNNIRQPGFGVGGYCLTKDPLFAKVGANALFGEQSLDFPFCQLAVRTNRDMPLVNLRRIADLAGGLDRKRVLLLGVAYRSEIGDTRHAPAEDFYRAATEMGARVECHDPFVPRWEEISLDLPRDLPEAAGADVVVFAVPHNAYRELDVFGWLGASRPLVFDCDNVLSDATRSDLRKAGVTVQSTGRGDGL